LQHFTERTLKQQPSPSLLLAPSNISLSNSLVPVLWSLPSSTALPNQTPAFSLTFLTSSPSYLPSHLPFFFLEISTFTSTLTANLPLNSWNCYTASTSLNMSTFPPTAVVTSWIWSGLTIYHLSSFNLNISDHLAIIMETDIPIPTAKDKRTISFRNLKTISTSALSDSPASKISASPLLTDNPSDLTKFYNETLSSCLNQLAPIKTKTVSFNHS